jgi:hypothetical protein
MYGLEAKLIQKDKLLKSDKVLWVGEKNCPTTRNTVTIAAIPLTENLASTIVMTRFILDLRKPGVL